MQNAWISVNDRLPEKSGEYLCFSKLKNILILPYSAINRAFNSYDKQPKGTVEYTQVNCSHWMPLPEYPKGE